MYVCISHPHGPWHPPGRVRHRVAGAECPNSLTMPPGMVKELEWMLSMRQLDIQVAKMIVLTSFSALKAEAGRTALVAQSATLVAASTASTPYNSLTMPPARHTRSHRGCQLALR